MTNEITLNEGQMTIMSALKELKHISNKIKDRMVELAQLSAKFEHTPPRANQQERVDSLSQSVRDLIERKFQLKEAIERANLETVVRWKGKDYTLRKILYLKAEGFDAEATYIRAMTARAAQLDSEAESHNRGRKPEEQIAVKRFFDQDEMDRRKRELEDMRQHLDDLLEHINLTTPVHLDRMAEE